MPDSLPLSALLSQIYVAFTIAFDNEFEHQVPHRTTDHGASHRDSADDPQISSRWAPWLVSRVMWLRLMRFIPDGGISVTELRRLTRLPDPTSDRTPNRLYLQLLAHIPINGEPR
jgi:hypothetical protein